MHPDTSLVIIDMQNDFVLPGAPLCVAQAWGTIPVIETLLGVFRQKKWPVFHIVRDHRPDGTDIERSRTSFFTGEGQGVCVGNTKGVQIVERLTPAPGEYIVRKRRFSAFFHTEFDLLLRRLKIGKLVITGTQYPNCVRGTAVDAMSLDYDVIVVMDACSAQSEEIALANVRDMKNMGISCMPMAEVVSAF